MFIIVENGNSYTYWDKKTNIAFNFSENSVGSCRRTNIMPEGKRIGGKIKDELEKKFVDFVMHKCAGWNKDGYPVEILQSAAGYYAGCYCEEGPYCRVSWYGNDKMVVAHWMYFNRPNK